MADIDDFASLQFVDMQEREYFAKAKLSEDVRVFLSSDTGRYLHGCARQAVEEYRDALEKCNPNSLFGKRKIRKLQADCAAARMFMTWCAEAIQEGEVAYRQLSEEYGNG